MNDMRDPNLVIGSWLEEGPTQLPDSTRRAITTSIRTVNQKRGFDLPWLRPARVPLRPALLAAALVVALAGVYLFGRFGSSDSVGPPIVTSSPEPIPSATISVSPPPLVGRIAFTRYDSEFGPFGDNLGTFTMNADGSDERQLELPYASDGIVWSPDGSQILLPNAYRRGTAVPPGRRQRGRIGLPGPRGRRHLPRHVVRRVVARRGTPAVQHRGRRRSRRGRHLLGRSRRLRPATAYVRHLRRRSGCR